ncbi:MAG TPA: hypothetical protein GXZ90_01190 [Clostridiales bacterium]|nr:hypothetical protein [Clostridiales bacterium]
MIKFNEIIKNEEYRKRIIKYLRLPMRLSVSKEKFLSDIEFIRITQPDWHNTIIEIVEHDFNKESSEQKTSTPDFTMEHILQPIILKFESSEKWQKFLKQDYSSTLDNYEGITNTHGFYKKENDGKYFVSVDLKAANWQSLQSIIGFHESYEELISQHTDNLIPPISKTFRTKITGILGAKQIMHYNKKILNDNKESILDAVYNFAEIDLRAKIPFAFYADEFLIEVDEETNNKLNRLDLDKLEIYIYNETGIKVHFTPFTLKWLDIEKGCLKLYKNKKYEIINLSKDILLILNKLTHNVEINEVDFEKIKLKCQTQEEYINKIKESLKMIENHLR